MQRLVKILAFGLVSGISISQAATLTSVYTDLTDKACKTLESDSSGSGWYKGQCQGINGYKLILTEADIRQSIDVITPKGKSFPLDLINNVSLHFSTVGKKAEWRIAANKQPVALILRYNANEDAADPAKVTSYLVVTKVTDKLVCITDIVKPQPKANEIARQLADQAPAKACKLK
ncbi:MAG: hypothetical protein QJT80_07225 [Candidatus Thiocaldithrix dubininis]|uniref:Uncharacterized protein n=1 Tax=Candidatus Thiocaldithrix dubininis TaxID=3080823 RepID=A0AA95HC33_9GAMM|nr:MAG: hypothetical protein QJT80_07225 [Candidatus Thiocaldithrix dubininis]